MIAAMQTFESERLLFRPLTLEDLPFFTRLHGDADIVRFLGSGKLEEWVLPGMPAQLPVALACNNMEAMLGAAVAGMGLAYMPDFLARDALARGELQPVLAAQLTHTGQFSALWPSSRQLSPKVRAFVDYIGERLFKP